MTVSYYNPCKTKYRITLDLDVYDDFNPHAIDWAKVLDIGADEAIEVYTEDLSNPVSW